MSEVYEASGKTVEDALNTACAAAGGVGLGEIEYEILEVGSRGFLGLGGKEARVRIIVQKEENPSIKTAQQKTTKASSAVKENDTEIKTSKKESKEVKEKPAHRDRSEHQECRQEAKENGSEARQEDTSVQEYEPTGYYLVAKEDAIAFLKPVFSKMQINPQYTAKVKEDILWISFSGLGLGSLIGRRGETLNSLQYLTNLIVNRGKAEHCRIVLDVEGYRQSREETLRQLAKKMAEQAVRSGRRVELEPMNPHERRIVHLSLQDDKRVDTMSHGEEPYRRVVIVKKHHHKNK